jgi:hypothetical protein
MFAIALARMLRPPSFHSLFSEDSSESIATADFKVRQYIGMGRVTDISFIVTGISRGGEVSAPSRGHSIHS